MKSEQGAPSLTPITESHQEDSRQAASSASAAANISMAASQLQAGSPSEEPTSPQVSSPDTSWIRNPSPPSQQFNESVREPDNQRQQPSGSMLPGSQLTKSADDDLYGSGDSFTESSKGSYNHPSSAAHDAVRLQSHSAQVHQLSQQSPPTEAGAFQQHQPPYRGHPAMTLQQPQRSNQHQQQHQPQPTSQPQSNPPAWQDVEVRIVEDYAPSHASEIPVKRGDLCSLLGEPRGRVCRVRIVGTNTVGWIPVAVVENVQALSQTQIRSKYMPLILCCYHEVWSTPSTLCTYRVLGVNVLNTLQNMGSCKPGVQTRSLVESHIHAYIQLRHVCRF